MGFFDVITQTVKVGLDVVTLPVNITKDICTMGGILNNEDCSTIKKLKKISGDVEKIPDKLDD